MSTKHDGDGEVEGNSSGGPRFTRRGMMRASAAAVGTAAVGGAAMQSDTLSPVGEAEAVAPLVIAGSMYVAAGAGGGVVVGMAGAKAYDQLFSGEVYAEAEQARSEMDEFASQNKFQAGRAAELQGEQMRRSMAQTHGYDYDPDAVSDIEGGTDADEWLGEGVAAEDTDWYNTVWDAVRATTADGIVESKDTSEIESDTVREVDRRHTRLLLETAEAWNASIEALAPVLAAAVEDADDVFLTGYWTGSGVGEATLGSIDDDALSDDEEVVTRTAGEEEDAAIARTWVETPIGLHNVEGYDESDAEELGDGETDRIPVLFVAEDDDGERVAPAIGDLDVNRDGQHPVWAEDPDGVFGDQIALNAPLLTRIMENAEAVVESVKGDIPEYVDETVASTDAGEIEPGDLIGPGDIIEGDALSEGDGLARQLYAQGVSVSDATQMTIDHPDVGEATGLLFASFSEDVAVGEGDVIPPEVIDRAIFAPGADTDDSVTGLEPEFLDPAEPIEIIALDREEIELNDTEPVSVEDNIAVIDAGMPLAELEDDDYAVRITDVDGDEYTAPSGMITESEGDEEIWEVELPPDAAEIESIEIIGAIDARQREQAPPDPSAGEDMQEVVDAYAEQRQDLEDAIDALEDAASGGGPIFGDGGNTTMYAIGAAVLASVGLGFLLRG